MNKKNKPLIVCTLIIFICSTVFFLKVNTASALTSAWIDEVELGQMCINQVVPTARDIEIDNDSINSKAENNPSATGKEETSLKADKGSPHKEVKMEEIKISGDPQVIIYHTHSTESYLPYKESNYHRVQEEGTVRDVGNVLEEELKKQGINVVHDKTVHDRPSYNESYGRSLNTVKGLMKKYPTAKYIIDLHRDAAASSAKEGKTLNIGGEKTAKYSLVVGRGNENYSELYSFAKKVSQKSESLYKGFGGAIIEKEYRYNGFVSSKAILLEVGNNKNKIEESRACAGYFAEALAEIIKGK